MSSLEDQRFEPALSPVLRGFMTDWQPKQRRSLGLVAALLDALGALQRAHPEWAGYDLHTHLMAGLHLAIENHRLTGSRTLQQLTVELAQLCSFEQPQDLPQRHLDIAHAVFGVLLNSRHRQTRFRDTYLAVNEAGVAAHPEQTFAFLQAVGGDDTTDPRVKASAEGMNLFQTLHDFDPFDRAAAERHRSERMLKRRDYQEVAASVQRRTTSIHTLQTDLERLARRMAYNVRDIDYAAEVIPRLDDALDMISEQIQAEQRLADGVAEHMHHHAPDIARLQRVAGHLTHLLKALTQLHAMVSAAKETYEQEQDRQLFTHRRLTINPQADLLEPLLRATPTVVITTLEQHLVRLLGPRRPQILNLQGVIDRTQPADRTASPAPMNDPFDLGEIRAAETDETPAVVAVVTAMLAEISEPTALSLLLSGFRDRPTPELNSRQRDAVPWVLAVSVACAYDGSDQTTDGTVPVLDSSRFAVVRTGVALSGTSITGDDLTIVPLMATRPVTDLTEIPT